LTLGLELGRIDHENKNQNPTITYCKLSPNRNTVVRVKLVKGRARILWLNRSKGISKSDDDAMTACEDEDSISFYRSLVTTI
jgi:hypothetical protein